MKKTALFILVMALIISAILIFSPQIIAQTPRRKATHPFVGLIPNPVGVNQEVLLHIGITDPTPNVALGWEGLTISVEKPDGTTETIGPIKTDATGGTGAVYIPNMVGTYKFQTHFPEQVMFEPGTRWTPAGTIMESSSSEIEELVVQQERVEYYPGHSLPQEYWVRPIDGQLREWQTISGNWPTNPVNAYAPYNENAPETGHILWTKPIENIGGLVGGKFGDHAYDMGDAYEGKFATGVKSTVIIHGILFYNRFAATGSPAQGIVAVDLHTGEELWFKNNTRLTFGQIFYWDSYNLHGAYAYLWVVEGSTWKALDPSTGEWMYTMENVPGTGVANVGRQSPASTVIFGPKGEMYRYTVNLEDGWMSLWNSSRVGSDEGSWGRMVHGEILDATTGIEWNVSLPAGLTGRVRAILDDRLIGMTRNRLGEPVGAEIFDPIRFWAVSTKPGEEGNLLFDVNWVQPPGNLTFDFSAASFEDGVFIMTSKETRAHYGFSIYTGENIWGPTISQQYMNAFDLLTVPDYPYYAIADGKFYSGGMGGTIYVYNIKTGELLWDYELRDPYNEILWSNNWPNNIPFVTDGKVYVGQQEHSPIDPLPRGAPFICLDAETGEEIWSINLRSNEWGGQFIIGDSIIAGLNSYDNKIYAIGKGPSVISLETPVASAILGYSLTISGSIMDASPGTEEAATKLRFPNGVPVVADESMSNWMEYVYLQHERPTNTQGVTVKIEAIDPNGNYQNLGTTTSDAYGHFGFGYRPEIPGTYMIIATFEGSDGYYGSTTTTYLTVDEATPSTPIEPEEPTEPEQPSEEALISTEVAIIVAVVAAVVIGVAAYWTLRRRQ